MKNASRHLGLGKMLALALSLLCAIPGRDASAQVLVTDTSAIASNHADASASYLRQGLQYARQAQQLAQEVAMLNNILMKAQRLGTNVSLFDGQLQEIDDLDQVVQSACPGADQGLVANLLNTLSSALSPDQPITKRQQVICAQIVLFQIDEYNKTAKALNAIGGMNTSTLDKLNELIALVDTLGETSNAQAQAASISATVITAMGTWQSQIEADEKIIATLQQQQAVLATLAMKGNNTVLGNVIQAAALKAAFDIDH